MSSRSAPPGAASSAPEVTNVSSHGFWLLIGSEELFLPFSQFPWFRAATLDQLFNVQLQSADHLHWPDLDVDLSVQSIRTPSAFPLVARARA